MIRELLHTPRPAEMHTGGKASPDAADEQKGSFGSLLASITNANSQAEDIEQEPVTLMEPETEEGTSPEAADPEVPVMAVGEQLNERDGGQSASTEEAVINAETEKTTEALETEPSAQLKAAIQSQSGTMQESTEPADIPTDNIPDGETLQSKEGHQQVVSDQAETAGLISTEDAESASDRVVQAESKTVPGSSESTVFSAKTDSGMYPGSSLSSVDGINLKEGSQNIEDQSSDQNRSEIAAGLQNGREVLSSEGGMGTQSLASAGSRAVTDQPPGLTAKPPSADQTVNPGKPVLTGTHQSPVSDGARSEVTMSDGAFRIVTEKAAAEQVLKQQNAKGKNTEANGGRIAEGERSALHISAAEGIRSDRLINMGINGAAQPFAHVEKDETEPSIQDLFKDIQLSSEEMPDLPEAEQQRQAGMRMGEFTIQNELVRRSILPSVSQVLSTATSEGKEMNAQWQKHRVELENGSSIRLSTRQADGVIQLRIGSDNPELTKILQQHLDEIKARLEEEFEMTVELDLESNGSEQQTSNGFFEQGDGSRQNRARTAFLNREQNPGQEQTKTSTIEHSVRRFGYNQMEWTA